MVVLDPDGCRSPRAFLLHHLGKVLIDLLVVMPVVGFELSPLELEVAEGLQGAVGEAIDLDLHPFSRFQICHQDLRPQR